MTIRITPDKLVSLLNDGWVLVGDLPYIPCDDDVIDLIDDDMHFELPWPQVRALNEQLARDRFR